MKIHFKPFLGGDKHIEIVIPDLAVQDFDKMIWLFGHVAVMRAVEGRLHDYTRGSYRHIRDRVPAAFTGEVVKAALHTLEMKGFINIEKGHVVDYDPDWCENLCDLLEGKIG